MDTRSSTRQYRIYVWAVSATETRNAIKRCKYPLAVEFKNGGRHVHELAANVATGHASSLPAIYGLASMQEQDAVILLRKGGESIVSPSLDGSTI